MRVSLLMTAAIMVALACSGASGQDFEDNLKELNGRIESAVADGREWPRYPGGLAGFLFGEDSLVGNGRIYYAAGNSVDHDDSHWREAAIAKLEDGTWRVTSIRVCGESDFSELAEQRDFLLQASKTSRGFEILGVAHSAVRMG